MGKLLTVFVILFGAMFYGINTNADQLKKFLKISDHAIIPLYMSEQKHDYSLIFENETELKKIVCIQIDGIIYCHES